MLDHINQRAVNACLYIFIAFVIGTQYDEEGRQLMLDFRALSALAVICCLLFLWNCLMLVILCWRDWNSTKHRGY